MVNTGESREKREKSHLNHSLFAKPTRIITVSVTRLCSLLGLELMVKLRTLLTVFTFILKAEARDYGKGHYISDAACQVKSSHLYLHSAFNNTNCDKATAQYQNGKIVS